MEQHNEIAWKTLINSNAIEGEKKIECVTQFLHSDTPKRIKVILLKQLIEELKIHENQRGFDLHAYHRLKIHFTMVDADESTLKDKNGWEKEMELPLLSLFESLGIPFPFKSMLDFRKAVLSNGKNWDIYFHESFFSSVLEVISELLRKLQNTPNTLKGNISIDSAGEQEYSFHFIGNEKKLRELVNELSIRAELIDETRCSTNDLINVLLSKNFKKLDTKIFLNCETTEFRYILDKLKSEFSALSLAKIGKSGIFISKQENPITASNLYNSKIDSPKRKEVINKIFKQV